MKPHNMTNREWKMLSNDERMQIEHVQEMEREREARDFDSHMRYGSDLSSREITWLRDRVLELERIAGIDP